MKSISIFLAIFAAASASLTPGLRIKFDFNLLTIGTTHFFDMPQTVPAAVSENWSAVATPSIYLPRLVLYCHETITVCLFYDDTGYIAGLQVAIDPDTVTEYNFDWDVQGWSTWTNNGTTYRALRMFFVSEEFLETSQSERLAARDSDKILQEDAVWVQKNNDEFTKILVDNVEELTNTNFTLQGCIPFMGTHLFYNMTSDLTCTSEYLFPWFQLMDSDQLIGVGSILYGSMEVDSTRDWFERPEELAVRAIVTNGPECLYELASSPGIVTMHVYFIDQPWTIGCEIF